MDVEELSGVADTVPLTLLQTLYTTRILNLRLGDGHFLLSALENHPTRRTA